MIQYLSYISAVSTSKDRQTTIYVYRVRKLFSTPQKLYLVTNENIKYKVLFA